LNVWFFFYLISTLKKNTAWKLKLFRKIIQVIYNIWDFNWIETLPSIFLSLFFSFLIFSFLSLLLPTPLHLEYIWLRVRVCVLSKTHEANVWLTKKKKRFTVHGPTINCVRNASRWKAEKWCFLARLSIQRLVHCSVNSVSCLHYSLNSGACEQCNNCIVHVKFFIFFYF
jgi:hypothetical protein